MEIFRQLMRIHQKMLLNQDVKQNNDEIITIIKSKTKSLGTERNVNQPGNMFTKYYEDE